MQDIYLYILELITHVCPPVQTHDACNSFQQFVRYRDTPLIMTVSGVLDAQREFYNRVTSYPRYFTIASCTGFTRCPGVILV